MSQFADDTRVVAGKVAIASAWNIGTSANGGYLLTPVLRALREAGEHPDPLSVTTHFLRPCGGGEVGEVRTEVVRAGRTTTVARGTLAAEGRDRLTVLAAFGDLTRPVGPGSELTPARPAIPPPEACVDRRDVAQGVDLPILDRVDVRLHPDRAEAGGSDDAVIEGWIRFADGTAPDPFALPLFADAFPPSLVARLGRVGWVPTLELTVHIRRRPTAGWIQARFECDDLVDGRMIETGTLWDASGAVVARSRQLGLLMTDTA